MGKAISEVVGYARLAGGGRGKVYRALKQLWCAPCGDVIEEGALFTRKSAGAGGLRILPRCGQCVPFSLGAHGHTRSELLNSLLAQAGAESPPKPFSREHRAETRRAVESRLGPALRRARRSRP